MPKRGTILDAYIKHGPNEFECPLCRVRMAKSTTYRHERLRLAGTCSGSHKLATCSKRKAEDARFGEDDDQFEGPQLQRALTDAVAEAAALPESDGEDWDVDDERNYGFDLLDVAPQGDVIAGDCRYLAEELDLQDLALGELTPGELLAQESELKDVEDGLSGTDCLLLDDQQHEDASSTTTCAWVEARGRLVHDGQGPTTNMTVLQAAFAHVEAVHCGQSIADAELSIKHILRLFSPECGKAAPDNPRCRYPPTYHICKVVVGTGCIDPFEYHVCEQCGHIFPQKSRQWCQEHAIMCNNISCHLCRCVCGNRRLKIPREGAAAEPVSPCYFFHDVLQQFFTDHAWYKHASQAHRTRSARFFQNKEGHRVLELAKLHGVDESEVRMTTDNKGRKGACDKILLLISLIADPNDCCFKSFLMYIRGLKRLTMHCLALWHWHIYACG
jgi:hypothetical protein